jgi:hypothetical protein
MNRLTRLTPLTGPLFAVLTVVGFALPDGPSANASGSRVIAYTAAHRSGVRLADIVATATAVLLVFFAGSLYSRFRETRSGTLGIVALVGAGIAAVGILLSTTVSWALTDSSTHYSVAGARLLNALGDDIILPVAAGLIVFAISMGIAVLREGWLPSWLGWTIVVLGVASATPAFGLGFFGVVAWCAVTGVMLVTKAAAPARVRASLSGASV